MENKGRVCPICDKLFSNGKALGGHMKAHLAKLPLPPKPSIESTKHSTHFNARSDPIPNLRSLKRNFCYALANSGGNSTFEFYPKIPTGKRSKRQRKQFIVAEEKEDITQSNEAKENAENTQCKIVYNNTDLELAETIVFMNRKEWQQINEKYLGEEVGRSGNEDVELDQVREEHMKVYFSGPVVSNS
ncbi:unnamed protein product [Trifolium pratense]|uniref:Uncharacterized protein n=1 Tax=Trifolium pratense TaxID=57577 RepID=A0ACB0J0L3_TRIPR|nr:unnamed protein product [Trifolium pratense]